MSPPRKLTREDKDVSTPVYMIKALIALIEDLVQVMSNEIALIENRRMIEHAELLKRKQRLTIDYRASIKSVALQPDIFRQIPDDLRQAAKAAALKLAEISERNAKVLRAAMMAAQRLIQTIVGIVKDEVLPKGGYINPHTAHLVLGTYSPTCKPVTFSRTA